MHGGGTLRARERILLVAVYVDLEALGGTEAYHVGASIKDAGKRAFAVSRIEDPETVAGLLARVASLPAG